MPDLIDDGVRNWFQTRLPQLEQRQADFFADSDLPELESWADNGIIHFPDEIQQRIDSYLDAASGVKHPTQPQRREGDMMPTPLAPTAQGQSAIHDGVPLSSETSIRLLEIQPGTEHDPIECSLKVADLEADPIYEALSYVWGVDDHVTPVYVNGVETHVRKNLFEAMTDLRLLDSPRTIWIDSLCINQKELIEKSHQVALMGQIYRSAHTVTVFLGPESAESSFILDLLHSEPKLDQDLDPTMLQKITFAFCKLLEAAWWRRIWTLQEYILARNDPILQFGRRTILASVFLKYYQDWSGNMHNVLKTIVLHTETGLDFQKINIYILLAHGTLIARSWYQNTKPWSFWFTHSALWLPGGMDPRDRIYALRELMNPFFKWTFPPDYTMPYEVLFVRGSIWLLTMDKFGDAWAFFPPLGVIDQPSWAFDFANPLERNQWADATTVNSNLKRMASRSALIQASIYDGILTVSGLRLGTINTVVHTHKNSVLALIKDLSAFDNRYVEFCKRLDMTHVVCQESQKLRLGTLNMTIMELAIVQLLETRGIYPYWALLVSCHAPPKTRPINQASMKRILRMLEIYEIGQESEIDASKLLDLIICDFAEIQAHVDSWKQSYPWTSFDFDEYLAHAVCLYSALISASERPYTIENFPLESDTAPYPSVSDLQAVIHELQLTDKTTTLLNLALAPAYTASLPDLLSHHTHLIPSIYKVQEEFFGRDGYMGTLTVNSIVETELAGSDVFFTDSGFRGYGYCGTKGIKEGDVLCLLDGIALPMVLRRCSGDRYYRIVGPVRVEGVMNGEALELEEKGILREKMYYIQ